MGVAAVLVAASLATAGAWDLRIDASGGPADLETRVNAALAAWTDAGVDVAGVERTVLVRYGDEALMGPDALTLVVTGGPPGVDLEVLVSPSGDRVDEALVVALGIALGGTPGSGALKPALEPDEVRRVSPSDASALQRAAIPGDIVGDGVVGFADLLALAEQWGRRGINLAADLDGDGSVGAGDLDRLREHYDLRDLETEPEAPGPPEPPEAPDDDDEDEDEAPPAGEDSGDDALEDESPSD